ncbi:Protein of unknown function [Pyronema omphalodes CBS 100304]|uniref:Uncharacterized protein n=1 Tax=Pyronema omphalodes (strain CBS 100304) TaxID=1076935 RepID=U4L651_PYROM|nr:Protein of unknown function [Pyronema omphalodes CBS 100304]
MKSAVPPWRCTKIISTRLDCCG